MMKSPNTERGLGPMLLLSNGLEGNAENTGVYILFENSYTFHNFSLNLLKQQNILPFGQQVLGDWKFGGLKSWKVKGWKGWMVGWKVRSWEDGEARM